MILSRAGRGYTKPPPGVQINWSHPLSQGLSFYSALNEMAGRPSDLASGAMLEIVSTQPTWVTTQKGGGIDIGAGTYRILPWPRLPTSSTKWSLAALVIPDTLGTQIIVSFGPATTGQGCGLASRAGGADYGCYIWGNEPAADGGTPVVGTPAFLVGTYDGANLRLYIDGLLAAGPTASAYTAGTSQVTIGGQAASSFRWTGKIFFCAAWTGIQLSPSQAQWLTVEPYALLKSQSPSVKYFLPVAAASDPTTPIDPAMVMFA